MKAQSFHSHRLRFGTLLSIHRGIVAVIILLAALMAGATSASAEILYLTLPGSHQIESADTSTNTVTPLFTTVGSPDSLLFDTSGNILYTNLASGEVRLYDRTTHSDSALAGGCSRE